MNRLDWLKNSPRDHSGTPRSGAPGIQSIGISCVSGFRARAFGAPRNDDPAVLSKLLAAALAMVPRGPYMRGAGAP